VDHETLQWFLIISVEDVLSPFIKKPCDQLRQMCDTVLRLTGGVLQLIESRA
jgi:hypothetical protein